MDISLHALHGLTEDEQAQDSARSDESGRDADKDLLKPGSVTPDTSDQGITNMVLLQKSVNQV